MHQQQIEDYDEDRGKIGRAIQKFNIKSKLLFIGKYEESNSYAYVQGKVYYMCREHGSDCKNCEQFENIHGKNLKTELLRSEKEADFNKRGKSSGLCMGCIKGKFKT